ncbi:MAG: relaxase/mobilization nuclease domain-containing protein [Proteobacteria bacterium]|nr:relaxase/mobilization nuclease domain-containing protein [Pseudomonadota bacterium]
MAKTLNESGSARPLLDIASYARRGPGHRDRLSPEEIQLIERAVRRTPEVMVKVLSRGGQDAKSVGKHFAYLSRKGDIEIETDDDRQIEEKGAEADLLEDWDLDIQEQRPTSTLHAKANRNPPKLVHKVLFSMPPGTPPRKVLEAVKMFAREEFGAKHRYAMVLHTDEPHPHVHMVIKAVSEERVRLNIRKAILKAWRRDFAQNLRSVGVQANATDRSARGAIGFTQRDGVYRASRRADLEFMRGQTEGMAAPLGNRGLRLEVSAAGLTDKQRQVTRGWLALARTLLAEGRTEIAADARRFASQIQQLRTAQELTADELRRYSRRIRSREDPIAR